MTFTDELLDTTCRYGEETLVFNDRRLRRDTMDAAGLHTFDTVPEHLYRVPRNAPPLDITTLERQSAAALYGCAPWEIGPCAGCGTPVHRYGPGSWHACRTCRDRVVA